MRLRSVVAMVILAGCSSSTDPSPQIEVGSVPPPSPITSADPTDPPPAPAPAPAPSPSPSSPPPVVSPAEAPTLRTLIVGNSQIYFWSLPQLLSDLSLTVPAPAPRIAAEGFTRGGATLEVLWNQGDDQNRNLATTIRDGHYDVVVIAESIALVSPDADPKQRFVTYAGRLIDATRAAGAKPVLYATPYVDNAGHWGFTQMAEPQLALGKDRGTPVAAGGLAWLRVWKVLPNIVLHHTDYAHPGYKGSVISALVLYSVITGASPQAVDAGKARDCGADGPCAVPLPAEADVFKAAAWDEVRATGR